MLTAIAPASAAPTTVTLTSHRRQRHNPTPVKVRFWPPYAAQQIEFGSLALAASIARTSTLAIAPDEMLRDFEQRASLAHRDSTLGNSARLDPRTFID
jgi:hypothetical protein